jgi:hypothetical protein
VPGFAVGDELLLLLFSHCWSNLLKTALYERELLLAANEEKERRKLVQTRAESKFICIMPSAAEVAQSECLSVGKAALHGIRVQRVAPFPNLPRKDNNGENKATGTQSFV